MSKKFLHLSVLLMSLCFIFTGCSGKDNVMTKKEREEMSDEATYIVKAFYEKTMQVEKRQQLDVIEGRKGYSTQVLKGVIFKVLQVTKGDFKKKQFMAGASLPQMSFGIGPLEEPKDKLYTFYLLEDPQIDKDVLIGAEWHTYG